MKLALLDTDFISKTHTVRIDDDNHLIDRVLEMPGYTFVCHEQIVAELRVVEASAVGRHQRIPCEQVLREIYEDKFVELANGLLKYRQ